MLTIQFTTPWNVFTPRLFRYLKSEHVEAFWADGSLRPSSPRRYGGPLGVGFG